MASSPCGNSRTDGFVVPACRVIYPSPGGGCVLHPYCPDRGRAWLTVRRGPIWFPGAEVPLDETLHCVVSKQLRAKVLYLARHPRPVGHPSGIKMYYSLRREHYWPHIANDVYATVQNCQSCSATRARLYVTRKT